MRKTENKKLSQIVGELTAFFLNHGSDTFEIEVNQKNDQEKITIKTKMIKKEDLDFFLEKMSRKRETEIETYGWSLMGDTELEITGLLIDEVFHKEKNGNLIVTLNRVRKQP